MRIITCLKEKDKGMKDTFVVAGKDSEYILSVLSSILGYMLNDSVKRSSVENEIT